MKIGVTFIDNNFEGYRGIILMKIYVTFSDYNFESCRGTISSNANYFCSLVTSEFRVTDYVDDDVVDGVCDILDVGRGQRAHVDAAGLQQVDVVLVNQIVYLSHCKQQILLFHPANFLSRGPQNETISLGGRRATTFTQEKT